MKYKYFQYNIKKLKNMSKILDKYRKGGDNNIDIPADKD